jgi:hypothetical protein
MALRMLAKLPRRADSPAPLAPRLMRGTAIAAITPMITTTMTNSTRLKARFPDLILMIAYSLGFLFQRPITLGCTCVRRDAHSAQYNYRCRAAATLVPRQQGQQRVTITTTETDLVADDLGKDAPVYRLTDSHPRTVQDRYFETFLNEHGLEVVLTQKTGAGSLPRIGAARRPCTPLIGRVAVRKGSE